jgi:hypothetical protein
VKELVRCRGKAEVSRDEGLLKQLDQEMAELRRRDANLEQLSNTEDNIQFLQVTSRVLFPQHQLLLLKVKCLHFSSFLCFSDLSL